MDMSYMKTQGGGSVQSYMWFSAICPLSTPPTSPLHILMSYKDTLSPLSPSPLGNCKNHNNQSLWNPLKAVTLIAFGTWGNTLRASPGLPPSLVMTSYALSKTSSMKKALVFIGAEMYSGRHLSVNCLPLETALAAILQARSWKTGKGNFTLREWHLHVYLHLFTAVAEWKQPQATEREE